MDRAERLEIQERLAPLLPLVFQYLRIPECSKVPLVNTHWNRGALAYKDYVDLRDCVPAFVSL